MIDVSSITHEPRIQREVRRSRAELNSVPGLWRCGGFHRRGPLGEREMPLYPVCCRCRCERDDLANFYAHPPIQPRRFAVRSNDQSWPEVTKRLSDTHKLTARNTGSERRVGKPNSQWFAYILFNPTWFSMHEIRSISMLRRPLRQVNGNHLFPGRRRAGDGGIPVGRHLRFRSAAYATKKCAQLVLAYMYPPEEA